MVDLGLGLAEYSVFVFSTVCHEAAHAWAAQRGGDATAARGGQVGLDPLPHIRREPFGMVVIPLLGLFTGGYLMGWASTPYDPRWAATHPKRAALMSLAGPLANLALVCLAALAIHAGIAAGLLLQAPSVRFDQVALGAGDGWPKALGILLSIVFSLNLLLFFFNLVPLPPLDGAGILGLIPGSGRLSARLRDPRLRLVGLLVAFYVFPLVYEPIETACLNLLYPGSNYH